MDDDDVQINEDDDINLVFSRFDSTRSLSILVFALMGAFIIVRFIPVITMLW